ncbi:ComEC/Rec2 family competence protein [Arthrobacter sp. zg-Y859]|uniref:ComEC/Rec2 family competence protein n=2 Tax=Arthrobacter jinronghuae TaxID=2964609 RepID=A0ABT1NUY2_9MICC|nr:ComEC/Rec2 family competence protein [Arthrobacter jinronghuae]MCQ1950289.1 ComEC/Rec2 family competence protein [Arthrobacter jinronghuae]UWX77269.1 ComEC/Rec2 family competence protein [Arthrobacter jinronghuae]
MAAAALVCASAAGSLANRTSGPISELITAEAVITAEMRAVSDARPGAADRFTGSPRYLIDAVVDSGTADGHRFRASATLLVVGGEDYGEIRMGDRFTSAGPLHPLPAGDRNLAMLPAAAPPEITGGGGWYAATARLRDGFVQTAEDRDAGIEGLLPGMVLGDRGGLDSGLEQAMKNTGLTHLTAVSGANCSYLIAFIFLAARALRVPRVPAALLALTGLGAFVLLVRPDPSVLRAAVMGGLGTLAVLSGRGRLSAALLFLSITVLLCVDPWLAGSYAFILSVCATLGLVVLGPHLVRVLSRRLPGWFAAAIAIPVAAQLFCAPVLVTLQPQLPVYSVPANLVAAPVVPVVSIAGMFAVALVAAAPVLAVPPLLLAAGGAWWVARTARFFESAPGALAAWPDGTTGVLLMAGCTFAAVAGILHLSRRERWSIRDRHPAPEGRAHGSPPHRILNPGAASPARGGTRTRRWLVAGAAAALVLPGGMVLAAGSLGPGQVDEWVLAACDVGQGDAFAVRSGPGSAVVIDAGSDPDAVDSCLDRLDIQTVDMLVLSHAHQDHYGGTSGVLAGRNVLRVGYSTADSELPGDLVAVLDESPAPRERLVAGMAGNAGSVSWSVLWPLPDPGDHDPRSGAAGDEEENNSSAVLLVTVAENPRLRPLRILFTGDIEEDAAATVIAAHPELGAGSVDVLKVAHHGARNGGGGWVSAVSPPLALVSVGADNDYGHPAPQTLAGLEAAGTAVARTDEHGTLLVAREGDGLQIAGLPP